MNRDRIYISGKITGMESKARQLFEAKEQELREQGYEPINPMKLPVNHDKSWEAYMRECVKALCDCGSIYMMNNYRESKGANIELLVASYLGLTIIYEEAETAKKGRLASVLSIFQD